MITKEKNEFGCVDVGIFSFTTELERRGILVTGNQP